jgi:succinate dehydrogenase/fumarate reductase flavoprotein subunit
MKWNNRRSCVTHVCMYVCMYVCMHVLQAKKDLPAGAGEQSIADLDEVRNASGGQTTAELRLKMQMTMQEHAAVYRTDER